jgi:hypothetical protein
LKSFVRVGGGLQQAQPPMIELVEIPGFDKLNQRRGYFWRL